MPGDVNGQWQHDLYGAAPMRSSVVRSAPAVQSNKLLISNLEAGVTDEDIHVRGNGGGGEGGKRERERARAAVEV